MDRTEATRVMARLAATFSASKITDDVFEVWYEAALQGIGYELGLRVAQRLADTEDDRRMPPPARFNAMRRAVEADTPPDRPQIDTPCRYDCTAGWLYDPTAAHGIYEFVRRCPDCLGRARPAPPEPGSQTRQEQANVRRFIGLCREVLEQRDRRPHWHGGPDPCPVCGGINPNLGMEQKRAQQRQERARPKPKPPRDPSALHDAIGYRHTYPNP